MSSKDKASLTLSLFPEFLSFSIFPDHLNLGYLITPYL